MSNDFVRKFLIVEEESNGGSTVNKDFNPINL